MNIMLKVWRRRYPQLTPEERDKMFRCRPYESRAHGGNFEEKILKAYAARLKDYGILDLEPDIERNSTDPMAYEIS